MASVRLCVVAGLTAIAAVMSVDLAIAQDCPEWLKWACPGGASSNAAGREGVREDQQPSRTQTTSRSAMGGGPKQTRPAAADTTTNPKPQQARKRRSRRVLPRLPERPATAMGGAIGALLNMETGKGPALNM